MCCILPIIGQRSGMRVNWERLAAARTILLVLLGFALLAVGAFLIYVPAGYLAAGALLVGLAYLTDSPAVRR